ncbi:CMRF35-like molecule 8 isoform X2 [Notolabrus celidotus]|uniref:CMRF35-like molecule 8 isoform X2 n=1 Tax=Notolabrus celidotus TaxID=1203425 RepID=UPI00148FF645|nr:CMRF35-like molecule 8 isoform X2 [Notolabrus celidotus]
MRTPVKVILCFMTGSLSLLCVSGNKQGSVNTCDYTPLNLTAHRGGTVTIHCKYPEDEKGNIKRFCKMDGKSNCSDLISTHTAALTKKDRYSLTVDEQPGVYTVIIPKVTLEDAGRYRCVVERSENSAADCFIEVHLQVLDWSDIKPNELTGKLGGKINICCYYPDNHEKNTKYLCKGSSPFNCETLIQTTEQERDVERGRFKIRDNKRTKYFFVVISDLATTDSGTYWCGSDGTWQQAEFNKTLLSVGEYGEKETKRDLSGRQNRNEDDRSSEDQPSGDQSSGDQSSGDQSSGDQSSEDRHNKKSPDKGLIGGVAGCLVLLLILVVVLVLARKKLLFSQVCCAVCGASDQRRHTGQNIEANHEDPHYEEIQNQQASAGDTVPSVYATINLPTDQLHYASVSVSKDFRSVSTEMDALPDANKKVLSACEYSTVMTPTQPPAAEQTVYSSVSLPVEP